MLIYLHRTASNACKWSVLSLIWQAFHRVLVRLSPHRVISMLPGATRRWSWTKSRLSLNRCSGTTVLLAARTIQKASNQGAPSGATLPQSSMRCSRSGKRVRNESFCSGNQRSEIVESAFNLDLRLSSVTFVLQPSSEYFCGLCSIQLAFYWYFVHFSLVWRASLLFACGVGRPAARPI